MRHVRKQSIQTNKQQIIETDPRSAAGKRQVIVPPFMVAEMEAHLDRFVDRMGQGSTRAALVLPPRARSGARTSPLVWTPWSKKKAKKKGDKKRTNEEAGEAGQEGGQAKNWHGSGTKGHGTGTRGARRPREGGPGAEPAGRGVGVAPPP